MPWRYDKDANGPYSGGDVYTPSGTEQFYYSTHERTPEEMARAYEQAMDGQRAREARQREEASRPNPQANWRSYLRSGYDR